MTGTGAGAREAHGLDLRVRPVWDAVKSAWEPCRAALVARGLHSDEAYQLAMVAQELLENAVKYGAFRDGEQVQLTIDVGRHDVTVEVRNRIALDDAHLRRFDRTIQSIRGHQDPFEAYVDRLKLVAARPYAPGESGLGLTRIAYEGRCALDFFVDEGNVLAVSAVYRREAEGA